MGLDCRKVFIKDFPRWDQCSNWSSIQPSTVSLLFFLFPRLPNHYLFKEAFYRNLAGADRLAHWQDSKYRLPLLSFCRDQEAAPAPAPVPNAPASSCLCKAAAPASTEITPSLTLDAKQDFPNPNPNFTTSDLWYMLNIFIYLRRGERYVQF